MAGMLPEKTLFQATFLLVNLFALIEYYFIFALNLAIKNSIRNGKSI